MPATTLTSSNPQWYTASSNNNISSDKPSMFFLKGSSMDSQRPRSSLCKMVEVRKSINNKKTKKNLNVNFNDCQQSHQLESHADIDAQQLWYSKQEIKLIRQEGKASLAKVNEAAGDLSALDETIGESIRGLEHGLSVHDYDTANAEDLTEAPLDRSERRKRIVGTILAQQHEQKDAGIDDPKGLQVTSKACTQWARDRALDQAVKDFDDAVQVWLEDAACAKMLPSVMAKKYTKRRSSSVLSSTPATQMSANERRSTLATITATVASALEELDDLDF